MQTLVQVVLPEMGESVAEGSVTSWRKKPGDFVAAGEALVDVTTDKVDVEVPSPASGKLVRILADEGKTVAVGSPLAEIDVAAPSPDGTAQPARPELQGDFPVAGYAGKSNSVTAELQRPSRPRASPSARRAAAARGIDLDRVTPAVPGESIRRADVDRVGQVPVDSQQPAQAQRLKGAAASLADHMERSLRFQQRPAFARSRSERSTPVAGNSMRRSVQRAEAKRSPSRTSLRLPSCEPPRPFP